MRGCAISGVLWLGGWLAFAGALMAFLQQSYGQPPTATLGVGLLAGSWAKPTRLFLGDAARVARDLASSALRRFVLGILAAAAAAGLVAAFLSR
jgi:hypothetical protein